MTTKIQNVSPIGALEVPLLGAILDAGEIVEVSDEHAAILLEQPTNFALAEKLTEKEALQARARELGLSDEGTIAELRTRITEHEENHQ